MIQHKLITKIPKRKKKTGNFFFTKKGGILSPSTCGLCARLGNCCIERLKHRNKLIKIADTSNGGWNTARQYEANPIASDPNDESKIIRAENRAIRKKKSKNKSSGPMSSCNTAAIQPAGYSYVPPMPPFRGFQQPWYAGFPFTQDAYAGKIQRGPCYACGSVKR